MATLVIRIPDDQKNLLCQKAEAEGRTVSEFVRGLITAVLPKKKKQGWRITGRPGRVIIMPPPGTPPITDADLDAAEEEYYTSKAL